MLSEKTLHLVPVPLTDLVVEENGSAVIISHSTGVCRAVTVNESGLEVWRLIDGQRAIGKVVEMSLRFWPRDHCDVQRIREDVVAFLNSLAAEGCLSFSMTGHTGREGVLDQGD